MKVAVTGATGTLGRALVEYYESHRNRADELYPSERRFLPWLAARADSVLDVGCGTGGFSAYTVVRFHGGSTGHVTDSSHTAIKVIVPSNAQSGPITVSTSGGTATSAGSFTFIVTPNFSLSVAPAG